MQNTKTSINLHNNPEIFRDIENFVRNVLMFDNNKKTKEYYHVVLSKLHRTRSLDEKSFNIIKNYVKYGIHKKYNITPPKCLGDLEQLFTQNSQDHQQPDQKQQSDHNEEQKQIDHCEEQKKFIRNLLFVYSEQEDIKLTEQQWNLLCDIVLKNIMEFQKTNEK